MWSAFHRQHLLGKEKTADLTGGGAQEEESLVVRDLPCFFSEENQHTEHMLTFQKHAGILTRLRFYTLLKNSLRLKRRDVSVVNFPFSLRESVCFNDVERICAAYTREQLCIIASLPL